MALAFHAGAGPVPGPGRRRPGRARGRLVSQCRLSGGRSRVVEHGNVGHGGHVGGFDDRFERTDGGNGHLHDRKQRHSEGGTGRQQHPEHGHGGAGHSHEHERRRRQRGGRPQHHQSRLALHRARAGNRRGTRALGPRSERATDIHMLKSGCTAEPTFSEQINAAQYVQATSEAVARYSSPSAAVAAGYAPVSPTTYPVVYYVNPTIVAANAALGRTPRPAARRRPRFRRDSIGSTGAGGRDVSFALNRDPINALRRAGPMAPAHVRLRAQ